MRNTALCLFAAFGTSLALWTVGGAPPEKALGGKKAVLVIHGGAGVLTDREMKEEGLKREDFERGLAEALAAGYAAWREKGKTGVDAVEAAIRSMEDCELFNAGKGAALNADGRAELDAAIMEGRMKAEKAGEGKADPRKRAGAVTGVTRVKNPISAARAVMEMKGSRHVLLAGEGADWFALSAENRKRYRLEEVSNAYFWTDRRLKQIRREVEKGKKAARAGGADRRFGTVGAAALKGGTLAVGTSTGGLTNKMRGRVGDSPLIGAGTYADDRACAVSCTGTGEVFIRHAVAHDVVARMLYKKLPVGKAAAEVVGELPDEEEGVGGLIALDAKGGPAFAMSAKCVGVYRGYVTEDGEMYVALFRGEALKRVAVKPKGTGR